MSRESLKRKKERAAAIFSILDAKYPNVGTFLSHESPFQLLIAVILSAQCTDERVNLTTPGLFKLFPTAHALAQGNLEDIKQAIRSINFFNNKAKNIKDTAQILVEEYNGEVPAELGRLVLLPGVGRKTANVVLGQAFGQPGITVDTHVKRLSNRLGFTTESDPVKAEYDLMKVWDKDIWTDFSSVLILHGRHTCSAQKPKCGHCELATLCPSFKA